MSKHPSDSRYDPYHVPFRGGPHGESKEILRLYARDRRRRIMWNFLLAIKFRYIFGPIILALIILQLLKH